jgi:hypothetical protein
MRSSVFAEVQRSMADSHEVADRAHIREPADIAAHYFF